RFSLPRRLARPPTGHGNHAPNAATSLQIRRERMHIGSSSVAGAVRANRLEFDLAVTAIHHMPCGGVRRYL
ncbi:MAG TPA: hypothetical protein VK601_19630, partial [Kofleriaceae bacterium]|nr:hypothetical protein [Kofleriaceae bacterium]